MSEDDETAKRVDKWLREHFTYPDVPVVPPLPPAYVPNSDPNPIVARCGECGLEIRQVMGYCCQHPRCPTGLGRNNTV